jgi:hypothetical protein
MIWPLRKIRPRQGRLVWFYAASSSGDHEECYVREGNSTKEHTGAEADAYKQANPRGSGADAR